ncbi:hypothetical protein DFLDMN_005983 [Cupriavidus sp. H19C3]|uniref:CoA transferase n=1 Tax=Cupriavidus sp. H19C3 TaxID=3241603 RepID=UPI003BF8178D
MSNLPSALAGLRVLELAQIMAGPTCGMMLADLGADVVKIEKLDGGDDARGYREPTIHGVSAPFLMLNRNKRGIALDLKRPEGREVFLRMVRSAAMTAILVTRPSADWLAAFDAAGVPAGPVHSVGQALSHPQTLARGMVVQQEHPEAGPIRTIGHPVHFSETPPQYHRPSPSLGEHTRMLLAECGYTEAEIDAMLAAGVVAEATPGQSATA